MPTLPPVAALTEFHYLLLYSNSLLAISRLNDKPACRALPPAGWPAGTMQGLVHDPLQKVTWVWGALGLLRVRVVDEDRARPRPLPRTVTPSPEPSPKSSRRSPGRSPPDRQLRACFQARWLPAAECSRLNALSSCSHVHAGHAWHLHLEAADFESALSRCNPADSKARDLILSAQAEHEFNRGMCATRQRGPPSSRLRSPSIAFDRFRLHEPPSIGFDCLRAATRACA